MLIESRAKRALAHALRFPDIYQTKNRFGPRDRNFVCGLKFRRVRIRSFQSWQSGKRRPTRAESYRATAAGPGPDRRQRRQDADKRKIPGRRFTLFRQHSQRPGSRRRLRSVCVINFGVVAERAGSSAHPSGSRTRSAPTQTGRRRDKNPRPPANASSGVFSATWVTQTTPECLRC
jgi:hypothetical protein